MSFTPENVRIRKWSAHDRDSILMLRNEPGIRAQSIDDRKIDQCDHYVWFEKVLHDPNFIGYVAEINNQLAGFGRAVLKDNVFEISVAVGENFRKCGIAKSLVLMVLEAVPSEFPITAKVRENNFASKKLFNSLEFKPVGSAEGIISFSLKL